MSSLYDNLKRAFPNLEELLRKVVEWYKPGGTLQQFIIPIVEQF
ncbi:MAG: hypothetical protein PVI90_00550 [Desulfobacteraceae bacterium]|jgi:hypothetical protein